MTLPPGHVAAPLFQRIGPEAFAGVAEWLRDVAADCAIETDDGKIHSASVTWLAETVTMFDPATI